MRSELRPVVETLRLLVDSDGLRSYLNAGSGTGLEVATRRASFVGQGRSDYDQLRIIGENGRGIMRVTRGGTVVSPELLQDKSQREYFRQAMTLQPGGLYVSALDLSEDQGRIETPLKPVLRFATPVFDSGGRRRGIYVINFLGAN